jgi:replication factor A1
MNVKDLKENTPIDEITLTVTDKELPRDVKGGSLRVCNLKGKDETGEVKITLWNDDIDRVTVGDKIKITEGWTSSFQDQLQVSAGRRGNLEVLEKGTDQSAQENSVASDSSDKTDDDDSGFIDGNDVDIDISEEKL